MIYCLGNTNYDIVFDGGEIASGSPGGSKLNTAVSAGRLGLPVSLISRAGNDMLGENTVAFLQKNSVNTSLFFLDENFKTNLALAFLDDNKNASYLHYGNEQAYYQAPQVDFQDGDFLLFGSTFAIAPPTDGVVDEILHQTQGKQVVRLYDPNIRKKHANIETAVGNVLKRMGQAHIIKISDEDLGAMNLTVNYLSDNFADHILIITRREKEVSLFYKKKELRIKPQALTPVSTIGAGDGFNAGIIRALYSKRVLPDQLGRISKDDWQDVVESGNDIAAEVCRRKENYVDKKTNQ
ncbi:MAG: hypothetical protein K9J27_02725 [Bacteroidales bacterium]|nr:hypothetical protein [Bacteroidales bacterium]MCF8332852.1 hypothetical protein [Bacteroidales bacterium]